MPCLNNARTSQDVDGALHTDFFPVQIKTVTYPLTEFTKVLVITGIGPESNYTIGKRAEIIDLENSKAKCASLPDFPGKFYSSVGGLLDNKPVICGGFDDGTMSDQCFELDDNKKFQPSTKLSTRRSNAAAVVIDDKVIQPEKLSNFKFFCTLSEKTKGLHMAYFIRISSIIRHQYKLHFTFQTFGLY